MPRLKKTNAVDKAMWAYQPTETDMKAVSWCHAKNIKISPIGIKNDHLNYHLDIIIRGKRNTSKVSYNYKEVIPKMYEFYNYYYNKRKQEEE